MAALSLLEMSLKGVQVLNGLVIPPWTCERNMKISSNITDVTKSIERKLYTIIWDSGSVARLKNETAFGLVQI